MKKTVPSQNVVRPQNMLQVRIFSRDEIGVVRDETHETHRKARGLAHLQNEGYKAVQGLLRTRELLQVLALAAKNQSEVSADLVSHTLEEIKDELHDGGDLGWYVRTMQNLFEQAEGLPPGRGLEVKKVRRSLELLQAAS